MGTAFSPFQQEARRGHPTRLPSSERHLAVKQQAAPRGPIMRVGRVSTRNPAPIVSKTTNPQGDLRTAVTLTPLSLRALARAAGVSVQTVANVRDGR
jgi:hypothetical protein